MKKIICALLSTLFLINTINAPLSAKFGRSKQTEEQKIESSKTKKSDKEKPFSLAVSKNQFSVEKALSSNPKEFPKIRNFDFSKEYFKIRFMTPVSGYRYALMNKDKTIYQKHKHKKKDYYSLKDEDLDEIDFWSYKEPLVSVFIIPQPQTKNTVKLGRLLGYAAAGAFTIGTFGIGMATLALPHKISGYKVSKDFLKMEIEGPNGVVCTTTKHDIMPMSKTAQQYFFNDDHFEHFIDRLFFGIFQFEPECFESKEKIRLMIYDEKGKRVLKFKIKDKLKKSIMKDFTLGI